MSINGKQSVNLEEGIIEFENYFKQIPVPFKIYADFECNLRGVECYEGSYTKKYQDHIPCSFVYRGENAAYEFIKAILKEYKYCRKVMNKHFNKNLIMSEEEEHSFQQSNSSWICKKLIDSDEDEVRDYCHVTGKFRGAAHWECNINFQLTKNVSAIFQNLRGNDSHLIFNDLDKFDGKISVILNGLEKYVAFFE